MIDLTRVPHAATAAAVMALLRAGKDNQAFKLLGPNPQFVNMLARPRRERAAAGAARRARLLR